MPARLHGLLIIDKPAGWTSHDVVSWVRKWAGERKVGHAGTLDPAATGVLPVAINDGTRVLEFLGESRKSYVAEITFGVKTDTADADGAVIGVAPVGFSHQDLDHALDAFRGPVVQRPPAHSAIRINGKRAYALARSGVRVEMPERRVTIHELVVIERRENMLTLYLDCSKGTYIRSIAQDLGARLGCGAHLSNLVRTRSGPFCLAEAWPITELSEINALDAWPNLALHPDSGVADWPAVVMSDEQARGWQVGKSIRLEADTVSSRTRVYDNIGNWCGLAERDQTLNVWKPLRVIHPS